MSRYLFFIIIISFYSLETQSSSREQASRDYLVTKLEGLYKVIPNSHQSKHPIALRLAHILSLRATDKMSQDFKICKTCEELGLKDAQRALTLYSHVSPYIQSRHPVLYVRSLFEKAYLYNLTNQKSKAVESLKEIINVDSIEESLAIRAYFNLGQIYFESYDYNLALQAFNKTLEKPNTPWIFQASYNKIWSLYNLSFYSEAIQTLENFLLSSSYKQALLPEEQDLKDKLQKELVILYSRSTVTDKQLKFFYNFKKTQDSLNTFEAKNQRLVDLALSLSRIGRAHESNRVWQAYLEKETPAMGRLQAYSFLMDNYFLIQSESWIKELGDVVKKSFTLQKEIKSCPQKMCDDIRKKQKKYLKKLAQQSKKEDEKKILLSLYLSYNDVYLYQSDMLLASAVLAKDLKQHGLSQDLFQQASEAYYKDFRLASDFKKKKSIKKTLENIHVLQMEMAELSGDHARKMRAYDFYLNHGTNKDFLVQAQYQKIYLSYQKEHYKKASSLFKDFALSLTQNNSQKIQNLYLKAAHLSLSSLNHLNKKNSENEDIDQLMFEWSLIFSKKFPKQEKEFLDIHYTALFNRVKRLVSHKELSVFPVVPSSDSDILKAWDIISSVDLDQMLGKYKNNYYMNKLILAKELLKLEEMNQAISQLMNVKDLSKEDQKTVLNWNLWLAEARFDFYEVLQVIKKNHENTEDYYLKLAHLSELANKDYMTYYQDFLTRYPQSHKSFDIVMHIFNRSAEKEKPKLLKKYNSYFKSDPDLFSYLVLKLDNQKLNIKFLNSFIGFEFMQGSSIKKFIERRAFVNDFHKELQKSKSLSLPTHASGVVLARSIKQHDQHIQALEKQVQVALEMKDWLSQLIAFSGFHGELTRFYSSILSLPPPQDLTLEEKEEYKQLMVKQMDPYKTRADQLKENMDKMLSKNFIGDYQKMAKQDQVLHGLLKWELNQLLSVIHQDEKVTSIQSMLQSLQVMTVQNNEQKSTSIDQEIQEIHARLKKNPFHKPDLEKLLELEKSRNNIPMSYYLKNRIAQIDQIQGRGN